MYRFVENYCRLQIRKIMSTKTPVLYGDEASPPVRFVMMTAQCLDINLHFHKIDLFQEENKTDFYKKINPLQKVPTLYDGHYITDSHAIALYLCQKSNNEELYPRDLTLKSRIDEMLFFNSSTLFPIDCSLMCDHFSGNRLNDAQVKKWFTALDYLEYRLNQHKWLSDEKMRLGDLCCAATVSSLNLLIPSLERHDRINKWLQNFEDLPCYQINIRGIKRLEHFVNIFDIHTG